MTKILAALGIILLAIVSPGWVCPLWAETEIAVRNGKLSVDLQNADLAGVLGKLSQAVGMEIVTEEKISGTITLKFSDLFLRQGLERIVGQSGYALKYAGEGLRKVQVVKNKDRAAIDSSGTIVRQYGREEEDLLKCYNPNGDLVKEIGLSKTVTKDEAKNLKIIERKHVLLSPDNKFAALFTDTTCQALPADTEAEGKSWKGGGKLSYLDSLGHTIWEKELSNDGFRFGQSQISRDGGLLFTISGDIGKEILWIITRSGEEFYQSRKGEFGSPRKIKFSDNWQYMAFYLNRGGHYIKFIDLATGKERNCRYHTPEVKDMDFFVDDEGLATIKISGEIRYYDVNGKLIKEEQIGR